MGNEPPVPEFRRLGQPDPAEEDSDIDAIRKHPPAMMVPRWSKRKRTRRVTQNDPKLLWIWRGSGCHLGYVHSSHREVARKK